jgi:hypothetical protein
MLNLNRFSEGPKDDSAKALLDGAAYFKLCAFAMDGELCVSYELHGELRASDEHPERLARRVWRDVMSQIADNAKAGEP